MKRFKVTLKILSSDFYDAEYYWAHNCPITKALNRAGLNLCHWGENILFLDPGRGKPGLEIAKLGDGWENLVRRVIGMFQFFDNCSRLRPEVKYTEPEKPKDFYFDIWIEPTKEEKTYTQKELNKSKNYAFQSGMRYNKYITQNRNRPGTMNQETYKIFCPYWREIRDIPKVEE